MRLFVDIEPGVWSLGEFGWDSSYLYQLVVGPHLTEKVVRSFSYLIVLIWQWFIDYPKENGGFFLLIVPMQNHGMH